LSVKENTQADLLYLGPFRSRFLVSDVLSVLHKYLNLPICPDNPKLCELRDTKFCLSTCTTGELDNLNELINKYYLSTNNDLADLLLAKYEEYHNDLQFLKAEEVKVEAKVILKYYKFLDFLNKTKGLNTTLEVENRVYFVEDGLLAEVSGTDSIDFRNINRKIPYRENELLAVNKNQLDERWIVFNFMQNNL
jgi:excinuclease UvrABC nuclease subunit